MHIRHCVIDSPNSDYIDRLVFIFRYHAWICSGKRKGSKCASRNIREEALMREIQEQMGWNSDEMAIDDILKVEVGNQEVVVHRK